MEATEKSGSDRGGNLVVFAPLAFLFLARRSSVARFNQQVILSGPLQVIANLGVEVGHELHNFGKLAGLWRVRDHASEELQQFLDSLILQHEVINEILAAFFLLVSPTPSSLIWLLLRSECLAVLGLDTS